MNINEFVNEINAELLKMVDSGLIDESQQEAIKLMIDNVTSNYKPPKVEIIDDKYQSFNGHLYRREGHGYFTRREYLHVAMMENHIGQAIPEGYEVHHARQKSDGYFDKTKNDIEDLQLLTIAEHKAAHAEARNQETYVCANCGKEFQGKKHDAERHFCKPGCQAMYFAKRVTMTCVICGKEFETRNRGDKTATTCSPQCTGKLSQINRAMRGKVGKRNANGQFTKKDE